MSDDNTWMLTLGLLRASTALVDAVQAAVVAAGYADLRPAHGMAFVHVAAGNATVVSVGEFLGISKQAASVLVQHLVDRGYLRRAPSPADGRVRILVLTETGLACTRVAAAAASALTAEWRQRMGADVFATVARALGGVAHGQPIRPSW